MKRPSVYIDAEIKGVMVEVNVDPKEVEQAMSAEVKNLLDTIGMIVASEKGPVASVSVSVGYSLPYATAKTSCTVTLQAPQDENMIAQAQEAAFELAHTFANKVMDRLTKESQG